MRGFAVLLLASLGCTGPDARVHPSIVLWMEWPATVAAAAPFPVRLIGYGAECVEVVRFVTTPTVDVSAVTFEPYFLIKGYPQYCRSSVMLTIYDTSTAVRGLTAEFPRTYELRAASQSDVGGRSGLPVRTFGDVTVGGTQTGRVNAAGFVHAGMVVPGCQRIYPPGVVDGYVVENPVDPEEYWSAFVRGYHYEPPAPVCGETRVFHLVSRH